jgi:hypothetical protein
MHDLSKLHLITSSLRAQRVVLSILLVLGQGCSSSDDKKGPATSQELQEEVRLKADRTQLDELRKEIPDDVKTENDELAFSLNLTADGNKAPHEVWSKFNDAARKRRESYDKTERKVRDEFNKNEKKKRDDFLAAQKKKRDDFFSDKPTSDERNRFSNDQDSKRREYFDEERDRRKDFESEVRQKRADFEAYLREKRSAFDNEMKAYSKTFYEKKRTQSAVERKKAKDEYEAKQKKLDALSGNSQPAVPADPDLKEFDSLPKGKSVPLQPGTEDQ